MAKKKEEAVVEGGALTQADLDAHPVLAENDLKVGDKPVSEVKVVFTELGVEQSRVYSKEVHGNDFVSLAKSFVEANPDKRPKIVA